MELFFKENRDRLGGLLNNNEAVVLLAGKAPVKIGDESYPFTPDRNFYYITGLDDEKLIFLMYKYNEETKSVLFIERFDETAAKWTGEVIQKDEAILKSGIEDIKYIDEFDELFSDILFGKRIKTVYFDLEKRSPDFISPAISLAKMLSDGYPYIKLENIYNELAELRMIKADYEVERIKNAVEITKEGIYSMMKNAAPGMNEYEIEAYFDFELKKHGVKDKAFQTIAASGKNATILHYSKNNSKTKDNDLILFDVGAQYEYYNGDITRTFPVNGRFTERQRQIYDIVLRGQQRIIDYIKPGVPFKKLNEELRSFYLEELKKIGLIDENGSDKDVSKYYYHGVSHLLGLETHDVGRHNEGILKKGMVLTVEPGLYIEDEEIGIRIEDDVLITDNGCEVLSKDIIKTIEEIESFMRG